MTKKRNILIFGGGGYVGTRLSEQLAAAGHRVLAFDTFWYGANFRISPEDKNNLTILRGDIRDIERVDAALIGIDTIIHLACISNDPSFELNPRLGREINFESFRPIVLAAKNRGVQQFIYASSSSVYGIKQEENVTEDLPLEPLTDYSKYKAMCEEILLKETSSNFACTVVRPATICGYSPRQRFDLAVNILTNHAVNNGEITVFGGKQFRPNLHIEDMIDAYKHLLMQNPNKIEGEVFNVGGKNLTLNSIAEIVSQITQIKKIKYQETDDLRSYRVDSSLIANKIGFEPTRGVDNAVKDLLQAFSKNNFEYSLSNSLYFNVKRMKELNLA